MMISTQISGYSQESAEESLASALDDALDQIAEETASTHVLVMDVAKVGKGWKTKLNVVSEPKAKIKKKPKTDLPLKKKKRAVAPVLTNENDDEEEKEKKKKREREIERHLEDERVSVHDRELRNQREDEHFEVEMLLLYIEICNVDLFESVAPRFDFDSVHVLDGPLWEEAGRRFPDMELYEAAHVVSGPAAQERVPEPSKPSKRLVYAEELVDE